MDHDLTDAMLDRLAATFPDLDLDAYHVTGRLARLGRLLADRQEEVLVGSD